MVRTVLLPLFYYCFSFAFCILTLLSIYPHSAEMALNCSHMLSSLFVVMSVASSSGPVTGPAQCRKDCPAAGFMWQTWNVKGRPLNVCMSVHHGDTNTNLQSGRRSFILPFLTAHLWSYQHLNLPIPCARPSLLLSPSSVYGTCSPHKLFKCLF